MDYKMMLRGMMRSLREKHGIDPWRFVALAVKSAMKKSAFYGRRYVDYGTVAQLDFESLKRFSRLRETFLSKRRYREMFVNHIYYQQIMCYIEWLRNNKHKWE